ncbi:MAG: two-component regulator propeller domain-containing protein [Phycisphaerales bacterium JB043]
MNSTPTTGIASIAVAICLGLLQPAGAQQLNPNAVVRSILQDSNGHYWFGTWSGGVYRYDGHDLTLYTQREGLPHNQVRTILEDQHATIWFETGFGTSRYDRGAISVYDDRDYASKTRWQLGPDDLWFKGDNGIGFTQREAMPGVYRYDGTTFRYHVFPVEASQAKQNAYSVTGIDQNNNDRIWIATYNAVIGFDGEEFAIIDNESLGLTDDTGYLHVRCVFEDSKGRLWIGNNGIGVIMREGDETTNFTQAQGVGRRDGRSGSQTTTPLPGDAPSGEPSLHRVFSIGEDRDGNIWFGTVEQGAWRFDGTSLRQFTEKDGLHTKQVMAIYTDKDGDLWLGGEGVFKFNGTTFERQF